MTTPHYTSFSPAQQEAIRRLHESLVRVELRKTIQRHPWLGRRQLNPFALDVLLDQGISCEEWARML